MKNIFTLLLLLTTLLGFSQNTYQQGYCINNDGAKTECLIRNIAWKDNPTEFEYKLNETSESQKANIKNVSEFNVSGYNFRRFDVQIDRSGTDVAYLSSKAEPEWMKETVFLKKLVEGKATLYQYEDNNLVRYFVSADNGATAQQLVYKMYSDDGKVGYNNKFRGQLYNIMKSSKSANSFKYTKYNKDALVKLFMEYNGSTQEEIKDHTKGQNKSVINVKIIAGAAYASLYLSQGSDIARDFDFDKKAVFIIGAEAEIILPFNNGKWSLFANPYFQAYKNDGVNNATDTWSAEAKFIDIPLGVRHYMYLNSNAKLFVNAAYVVSVNVANGNVQYAYDSKYVNYGIDAETSGGANLALGAGFAYKKLSAEVRYNFDRGIVHNYAYWESKYSSVGIILGYKLF